MVCNYRENSTTGQRNVISACGWRSNKHTDWTSTSNPILSTHPHATPTPSSQMTDGTQAFTRPHGKLFNFHLMWLVLTALMITVVFVSRKACAASVLLRTSPTVPLKSQRDGEWATVGGYVNSWQFFVIVLTLIFSTSDRRLLMLELTFSWGRNQQYDVKIRLVGGETKPESGTYKR